MMHRGLRLTIVLALAACYVVGRLLLLAWPGISFSYLVLFVAGIAFGPRIGASVGFIGRITSDLLVSGVNPVFIPMALVDLILGALLGFLGLLINLGQRGPAPALQTRSILLFCTLVFTAGYSVLADTFSYLFYNLFLTDATSETRTALWGTLVLSGLVFNVPSILFNMVLIPSVAPSILRNLFEAGLLPERGLPPTRDAPTPSPAEPK